MDLKNKLKDQKWLIPVMGILGAALYRWRGASHPWKKYFPRPFNQLCFALPYAFTVYAFTQNWWWTGASLVIATLGLLTGHGGGMDLGRVIKEDRDDETLEFFIKPLRGKISEYWYDVMLMAITGLAVTLLPGIFAANPLLALSGILKAPAYMLGWKFFDGTEGGEWITGGFLWIALGLTLTQTI